MIKDFIPLSPTCITGSCVRRETSVASHKQLQRSKHLQVLAAGQLLFNICVKSAGGERLKLSSSTGGFISCSKLFAATAVAPRLLQDNRVVVDVAIGVVS